MSSRQKGRFKSRRVLVALALVSGFVTVLGCEIAARVWVAFRWDPARVEALTTISSVRGRFASHPHLPFVLRASYPGHNRLGFRGSEIATKKAPGVKRVACLGASTTYGLYVEPGEAWPAQLGRMLNEKRQKWEVINAGVPGWLSTDSLLNFILRVMPLEPDVVVVYQNRNELFPQAYNGFAPDYSHYRRAGFSFTVSNHGHKIAFRYSHLFMLLCTVRGSRFGWSERAEHPLYGGLVYENRPTAEELKANLADPTRTATLERTLRILCAICKERNIELILTSMAYRPDKVPMVNELGELAGITGALSAQVQRNNEVARSVASELGVTFVDTSILAGSPELFHDDCHLTADGHRRRAAIVFDELSRSLK